jgi:hypothetical protein
MDLEEIEATVNSCDVPLIFSDISENMNILSAKYFQYLCITTFYLMVGFAFADNYQQLLVASRQMTDSEVKLSHEVHLLVLKARFFDEFFLPQDATSELHLAFNIYASYFVTTGLAYDCLKPKAK